MLTSIEVSLCVCSKYYTYLRRVVRVEHYRGSILIMIRNYSVAASSSALFLHQWHGGLVYSVSILRGHSGLQFQKRYKQYDYDNQINGLPATSDLLTKNKSSNTFLLYLVIILLKCRLYKNKNLIRTCVIFCIPNQ